jgi:hypothetical protein
MRRERSIAVFSCGMAADVARWASPVAVRGTAFRAGFRSRRRGAKLAAKAFNPITNRMPVHFPRLVVVAILILTIGQTPLGVAAALPIFDAHLHYNDEAAAVYPVSQVLQRLRDNGVRTIVATSTPNDGTRALSAATRANPGNLPRVVPFLRPYRNAADRQTWFNDPAIYTMIETELARDVDWRGIGEFHLNGSEADTAPVKRMVALAVARGLFLHAHCDEAALAFLLRDDPRARIIWAHTGFSVTPDKIADYFARYPNLVGELSYRDDVVADGKLTPAWRALFLAYPDRFVVGLGYVDQ